MAVSFMIQAPEGSLFKSSLAHTYQLQFESECTYSMCDYILHFWQFCTGLGNFVCQTFHLLAISSICHFINLPFLYVNIFIQIEFLSACLFINLIDPTCCFVNLQFSSTCCLQPVAVSLFTCSINFPYFKLPFHQQISSICHFVSLPFHQFDSWSIQLAVFINLLTRQIDIFINFLFHSVAV